MGLIAQETGGADFDPIPPGVYVGTCYGVVDLGTHFDQAFGKSNRKVLIQWELPHCRGEFEKDGTVQNLPRAISNRYTLSLGEKANLRQDVESWMGRKLTSMELAGFDLQSLIGKSCQIQVVEEQNKKGKVYAKIKAIMALPAGTPTPKQENPVQFFSFNDAGERPQLPESLPKWVREVIMESKEWTAVYGGSATQAANQAPRTAKPAGLPRQGDPGWMHDDEDDVPMGGSVAPDPKQDPVAGDGFNPEAWRKAVVPYGVNLGVELPQLSKARLYAEWANFDPATAECDKGLGLEYRDMLDLAGAYYKFKKG